MRANCPALTNPPNHQCSAIPDEKNGTFPKAFANQPERDRSSLGLGDSGRKTESRGVRTPGGRAHARRSAYGHLKSRRTRGTGARPQGTSGRAFLGGESPSPDAREREEAVGRGGLI